MKKNILIGTTVLLASFVLSGCGSSMISSLKPYKGGQIADAYVIGPNYPSYGANEKAANRRALELAATATLDKGYKYFAFSGGGKIDNFKGSLINTAEEYIKACDTNSLLYADIGGAGLKKCAANNTAAKFKVAMFNEQQNDFVTYNANNVISYYKNNELLNDLDVQYDYKFSKRYYK